MNVGFIGLGGMGSAMATNLVRAGHRVQVWNRSHVPVQALVHAGAHPAPDLEAVFRNEVVVSMLADDAAVDSLLLRPELLADATAKVHVNMATVSIALARRAAGLHAEHGIGYVAAPVLGRPDAAAAAKLNVLAAGDPRSVERVTDLFDVIGQRTWRLGDEPHQANAAKITINFMLACAIGTLAEACALAEANGVDPWPWSRSPPAPCSAAPRTPATALRSRSGVTSQPGSGCGTGSRTSTSRSRPVRSRTCRYRWEACCAMRSWTRWRT
nr:NAD(P)-dependent oxidoreductase [Micromonospora sp. DSM 115978]